MKLFDNPQGHTALDNLEGAFRASGYSRRGFLKTAGVVAGAGLLLDACRRGSSNNVGMGSGDVGLLNYLYVISQVQAGFYSQAFSTPYYNPSSTQASELALMQDLRDHHLAYQAIFAKILLQNAVSNVVLQLSQVTFANRTSTLSHAVTLQDWAVGAYNGAAQLFSNSV